ncbi:hypothetical protein GJ496_007609 [Pomphorhynchus laevis]|nr:hypothetical protein GJ496_007609 [Pomphorhynchus laevis]
MLNSHTSFIMQHEISKYLPLVTSVKTIESNPKYSLISYEGEILLIVGNRDIANTLKKTHLVSMKITKQPTYILKCRLENLTAEAQIR